MGPTERLEEHLIEASLELEREANNQLPTTAGRIILEKTDLGQTAFLPYDDMGNYIA